MKSLIIKLLAATLLSSVMLSAQITSLAEAERLALDYALQLQIANTGVEKANIAFRDAVGSVLPTVSAYGQATTNQELPTIIIDFDGPGGNPPTAIAMGSKYSNTGGFSLSQPLFTGGAVLAGYKIAKEGVIMSSLNERITRDNTILTVRTFWYQYLLTRSLIDATRQALDSGQGNLDLAEKKFKNGTASQFEVLQARVSLEQLRPQMIQLENQLRIIEANLLAYVNNPDVHSVQPEGALEMEPNPFKTMTLDEVKSLGIENRPEIKLLEGQRVIAEQQRNIAVGMTLPMVSFSADVRHQAQSNVKSDLKYMRSKSTSINVSIPLFAGGKKLASIQSAQVALKEADLKIEQARTGIATEIESMYYKLGEAEQKVDANASLVEQANEALRLATLTYENGSSTQLDVQNARSASLQAKSAWLSAIFEYNLAVNQLKKSVNKL